MRLMNVGEKLEIIKVLRLQWDPELLKHYLDALLSPFAVFEIQVMKSDSEKDPAELSDVSKDLFPDGVRTRVRNSARITLVELLE